MSTCHHHDAPWLAPPSGKHHTSVVRLDHHGFVACLASELGRRRPLAGVAGALLDRCAHRNIPLPTGEVVGAHVQCSFHGWLRVAERGELPDAPPQVNQSTRFVA